MRSDSIRLFQTPPHTCGYYPERTAQNLVIDPYLASVASIYGQALAQGFRRAGEHLYLPHCAQCQACTPVRLEVAAFAPDRSQRRNLKRNQDLTVSLQPASCNDERFALYRRYLQQRHAGGGMDQPETIDFERFLACPWSPTRFLEIRAGQQLLAVAVTDCCEDELSAVYTFYASEHDQRGLGTFAILQQIELARRLGKRWLYLGFWIGGHPKMDYKRRFQPLQARTAQGWVSLDSIGLDSSRPIDPVEPAG